MYLNPLYNRQTDPGQPHGALPGLNEILNWLKYLRRILSFYMEQHLEILRFDVRKMGPRSFKHFAVNYKFEENERSIRIVTVDFNFQLSIALLLSFSLRYFWTLSEKGEILFNKDRSWRRWQTFYHPVYMNYKVMVKPRTFNLSPK